MYLRSLRRDSDADLQIAADIVRASARYAMSAYRRIPTADDGASIVCSVPADCRAEDCLVFGIFDKDRPLGVAKVLRACPSPNRATLALLLIAEDRQRRHCGCAAMEHLSKKARTWPGITHWQLFSQDSEPQALAFWRHCGFRTEQIGIKLSHFAGTHSLMERGLKTRPACASSKGQGAAQDRERTLDRDFRNLLR